MTAAFEMPGGIQTIIADFLSDSARKSMELPNMTTVERSHVKRALQKHSDVACESYGFGKDRKLCLFKKAEQMPEQIPEETVSNLCPTTNSEDWLAELSTNMVHCVLDGPVAKLDLSSIRESNCESSTVAPSEASAASTFRGGLSVSAMPWCRLPPGLEEEVQSTIVHLKPSSSDPRETQSMPRSMFRQYLLAEMHSERPTDGQVPDTAESFVPCFLAANPVEQKVGDCPLNAGEHVMIHGLSAFPAFNGASGTLQSLDEVSGRYLISLAAPVCGHKTVKVKRDNFRLVSATESLHLFSQPAAAPCTLALNALV